MDVSEIEAFLLKPETHGLPPGASVERIETHASLVFIAGARVYKMKKPVDFGFLDFTTLEKRRVACERELTLNRRTAPGIYLGLVPVRRAGAALALGGAAGEIVEWLVEMRRFPAEGLFARMADEGRLTRAHIEMLAADIERFHRVAEIRRDHGGADAFARIVSGSDENLRDNVGRVFNVGEVSRLRAESDREITRLTPLLDLRRERGFVRHCHGDLHLGNVTLIEGKPVIFDCIEFSDEIACIDILYDLAFLLMEVRFREPDDARLQGFANRALNVYFDHVAKDAVAEATDGLALVPLFIATREGVRAKVTAVVADTEEKRAHSRAYLRFALDALKRETPRALAVGGFSGTGKSTLAKALAPRFGIVGALHLRSDIVRKRLFGVQPLDRLPEEAYAPEVGARVYDEMMKLGARALAAGSSVVFDAVFARESERAAVAEVAAGAGAHFDGLWLEAPATTLEARVAARAAKALDPSDADVEVLRQQLTYELGDMRWRRIDAARGKEMTLALALDGIGLTTT